MTDPDDMRIMNKIAAQRARRPRGWAQRCARCAFWVHDDPEKALEDEDQEGECHRNSPRQISYHLAEGIAIIAYAIEELADIEHNEFFDYWYESVEPAHHNWPRTTADDWCGDFEEHK